MVVNDLAESSFAGVTAQLQVFGRIVISSAAAISNMARNGLLERPTTNKEMSGNKKSLFRDFPEELQISAIMCAVQEVTATRQSNTNAFDIQCNAKQDSNNLVKREGLENATY